MWTQDALASEARALHGAAWRVVEAQHRVATMRLVDTLEEQAILEDLVEEVKPPVPQAARGLHFLLAAPFRYAPYPHGSRFRRAGQGQGAFYASEALETALAEIAFYRLLFLAESPSMRAPDRAVEHTAFRVALACDRAIDLTRPPLDADRALWTHPNDYPPCQDLADAARAAGLLAIRYASVRDPRARPNIAVIAPQAFARKQPAAFQTWKVLARRDGVRLVRDLPTHAAHAFSPADFRNDTRLKALQSA